MGARRLLPSIVFASTALLTGCGGNVQDPSPSDASSPKDAASDIRACDAGWPTTKGSMCVEEGSLYCCHRPGETTEHCCVR